MGSQHDLPAFGRDRSGITDERADFSRIDRDPQAAIGAGSEFDGLTGCQHDVAAFLGPRSTTRGDVAFVADLRADQGDFAALIGGQVAAIDDFSRVRALYKPVAACHEVRVGHL